VVQDGSTCSSGCSDFTCYSVVPFNPMEGPAATATPDRNAIGGGPAPDAPATLAPVQRRR
jgi:hypothetical protein